jgi:hypothetical protein
MARNITLTLGAGLGADLGPNFNLTANVGSVTPSTATKSELTAGKSVSVDDAATEVTITSTGTCTNAITQTIPCGGTTTTTTAATTSTTTEPPTTTTTTAGGITYDNYHADQYDCATCTLQSVDTVIAFPTGTSVTVDKWYAPESLNGYVYRLTSLTPQTGPGLIMFTSEFNSCAFACMV